MNKLDKFNSSVSTVLSALSAVEAARPLSDKAGQGKLSMLIGIGRVALSLSCRVAAKRPSRPRPGKVFPPSASTAEPTAVPRPTPATSGTGTAESDSATETGRPTTRTATSEAPYKSSLTPDVKARVDHLESTLVGSWKTAFEDYLLSASTSDFSQDAYDEAMASVKGEIDDLHGLTKGRSPILEELMAMKTDPSNYVPANNDEFKHNAMAFASACVAAGQDHPAQMDKAKAKAEARAFAFVNSNTVRKAFKASQPDPSPASSNPFV
jgi:hypothetical protein